METLDEHITEEAAKCVRCGICKSVCPTFNAIHREPASARGKISLVEAHLAGDVELGEEYLRHIKECALCGACLASCPKEVDTPELVMNARAESVTKEGLPLTASFALKNVLGSERIMPLAFRFASRLQRVLLKGTSLENGLVSRFSLPIIGSGRLLPELPETSFLDLPEVKARGLPVRDPKVTHEASVKTPIARVGLFVGCGINYLLPGVGEATIRVLEGAGVEVVVPPGQVCCGMPALSTGEVSTARSLALKNLEVFEKSDIDYIVTACATCGHALKGSFMKLLGGGGPQTRARVENLSSRVKDITELLAGQFSYKGGEKTGPDRDGVVVTYHDPCHLGRAQGIRDEPRELLERSGMTFKEMKNPCKCCGLGGGLTFTNYDLSMEIAKNKVEDIKGTGAQVVATACPGCIIQLKDGLHRFGVNAKVVHLVELL
jgi:glycolate oxidase iron-sulfur subunit